MPLRSLFAFLFFVIIITDARSQSKLLNNSPKIESPKLVVGLVIDQMRWDFLYRYHNLYSARGFKRLLNEGFSFDNTMIPYVPTYTAPGHACIYTGSVPAINGIIGNNWFDKNSNKAIYCTEDLSPVNLLTTTISDELRISNNFKSKVIGIGFKDRSAILPAGHSANAAYWYNDKTGHLNTSPYYMKNLPTWVNTFNDKNLALTYMDKDWATLLPIERYAESTIDDEPYETPLTGEKTVTFPHKISQLNDAGKFSVFKFTPFANTFTFDFAKALIENETLGNNIHNVSDFLAISLSATDYIGHNFGPNSVEMQDTYLRLDNDIAGFLDYLDKKIGKGNYLFFLTADHGVANTPRYLAENKIPGGIFDEGQLISELNKMIEEKTGVKNIVQSIMNYQVYINKTEIENKGKDETAINKAIIKLLKQKPYILAAFETEETEKTTLPAPQKTMIINGYNPSRSGDIQFTFKPGYIDWGNTGTTHGVWNPYDAHIPLVWFGWKIKNGNTHRSTYMTDIAPTLASKLHIQMPNGCVGNVLNEIF